MIKDEQKVSSCDTSSSCAVELGEIGAKSSDSGRISVKSCLTTCLFQDKKEEYETINQQPLGRLVRIDHKRVWSQGI